MSVIVWPCAEQGTPPQDFEEKLCARLRGRVERVHIFGSYGTPDFRIGSDIDLILVVETALPFIERARQFMDLHEIYPRMDILVYTSAELNALLSEPIGFWASVKKTLRELPLVNY